MLMVRCFFYNSPSPSNELAEQKTEDTPGLPIRLPGRTRGETPDKLDPDSLLQLETWQVELLLSGALRRVACKGRGVPKLMSVFQHQP